MLMLLHGHADRPLLRVLEQLGALDGLGREEGSRLASVIGAKQQHAAIWGGDHGLVLRQHVTHVSTLELRREMNRITDEHNNTQQKDETKERINESINQSMNERKGEEKGVQEDGRRKTKETRMNTQIQNEKKRQEQRQEAERTRKGENEIRDH